MTAKLKDTPAMTEARAAFQKELLDIALDAIPQRKVWCTDLGVDAPTWTHWSKPLESDGKWMSQGDVQALIAMLRRYDLVDHHARAIAAFARSTGGDVSVAVEDRPLPTECSAQLLMRIQIEVGGVTAAHVEVLRDQGGGVDEQLADKRKQYRETLRLQTTVAAKARRLEAEIEELEARASQRVLPMTRSRVAG
jgi:hypothetical protein